MKKCSQQHGKRTIGLLVTAVALLIPTLANAWSLPKGGNWADADDNFQSGLIVNSGLTSNSSQANATNVANQIASDLAYVGANFVRVGVNPYSVADQSWWLVMKSYINQLIARGFNVDLCYWTSSSTVGTVESFPNWSGMWEKIDGVYGTSAYAISGLIEPMLLSSGLADTQAKIATLPTNSVQQTVAEAVLKSAMANPQVASQLH